MSNLIDVQLYLLEIRLGTFNDGGCVSSLIEFGNIVDVSNNLFKASFTD